MKYIDKLVDMIAWVAKILAAVLLAVMLLVVVFEVGRRYFFGASFPWGNELVRFLMVWVAFVGGAAAFKDGGLVFFDMVLKKLPPKVNAIVKLMTNTTILAFCCYMFYMALQTNFSRSVVAQIAIGLQVSMAIPYFGITLGFALLIIFSLYNYSKLIPPLLEKRGQDK